MAWICVYISFIQKCFQTQGWMTHLSIKSWTESGWQNRSYFIVVVILQVIFPFKYYRNSHNRAGTAINTREYIWIGGKSAITFEYRVRGAAFCNDQTRIGWAIGCITVATWTISHDDQDIFCGFSLCFWTLWLWTLWLLFFISYLLELELKNSILVMAKVRKVKVWSSFIIKGTYKIHSSGTKIQMNSWYLLQSTLHRTLFET